MIKDRARRLHGCQLHQAVCISSRALGGWPDRRTHEAELSAPNLELTLLPMVLDLQAMEGAPAQSLGSQRSSVVTNFP